MPTLQRTVIAGLSALMLGGGAAAANAEPPLAQSDRDFLIAAHQSNMTEIAAGGRANAMSSCPAVRELAPALVADHLRLDGMVTAVADRYGLMLPALPDAEQVQTLAAIAPKTGRDFDVSYLRAQEEGHLAAARNGHRELDSGVAPEARGVAEQSTPIVEEHLAEVRTALDRC
ncbi:putative membrane protein [Nocardia transvalensis]|uniref:Putative membrane protein n=1 Tax=Nocardia transvalensis TaxID=37333 RepID=A0A7W9PKB8_9NOCA|nr:DUF4142 domain-containing protein [Nocardia transvalensis]MBB5917293.1 putative membrane protein [Nocardia transvalensis]